MNHEKKWMLITYYCPTHGNFGIIEASEFAREDLSQTIFKRKNSEKEL